MSEITRYIVSDSTDLEDLFLSFLRMVLAVPLVDNVRYTGEGDNSSLIVNIADNINNKKQNAVPAVFIRVGETRWEDSVVDASAGYTDDESRLFDETGKLRPVYTGGAKRTLFSGITPISLEVRIYGRKPCARFSGRLSKILQAFVSYLHGYTNVLYTGGINTTPPTGMNEIAGVYTCNISLTVRHLTIEDIPQLKNVMHQFFLKHNVRNSDLELYNIVSTEIKD